MLSTCLNTRSLQLTEFFLLALIWNCSHASCNKRYLIPFKRPFVSPEGRVPLVCKSHFDFFKRALVLSLKFHLTKWAINLWADLMCLWKVCLSLFYCIPKSSRQGEEFKCNLLADSRRENYGKERTEAHGEAIFYKTKLRPTLWNEDFYTEGWI